MINTGTSLSSERAQNGYSLEDKFFYDQEQERRRRNASKSGDLRVEAEAEQHCPKCSAQHHPTKLLGVDATECGQCHGIFLSEEQAKAVQDLSAGQASG